MYIYIYYIIYKNYMRMNLRHYMVTIQHVKTLVLRLLRCEGRHFAHGFIGHCLDHVRTLDARRGVASVKG